MPSIKQFSLAGGELSPSLHSRADLQKYSTGAKTLTNFICMRQGGIQNRAGTKFVGEVEDSARESRLIPFIFSSDVSYVLEFGDEIVRFISEGAYLTDLTLSITGVTSANPAVVTYTGTDPANGDEMYFSGLVGDFGTYLNGRNFKVANVDTGANTFELDYLDGTNVDSTTWGTYEAGSSDTAKRIYTVVSPYDRLDLATLQFVQSADVITITHQDYPPKNLIRTAATSWAFSDVEVLPILFNGEVTTTPAGAGSGIVHRYKVSYLSLDGEESFVSSDSIGGAAFTTDAASNPVNVNLTAHGYSTGDEVFISVAGDVPELEKRAFRITRVDADNFTLDNENGATYAAETAGLLWRITATQDYTTLNSTTNTMTLTWNAPDDGALEYYIYKETQTGTTASPAGSGVYGFIGTSKSLKFIDTGFSPEESDQPIVYQPKFLTTDNYPACVGCFQQRRLFANTVNNPETVYASRTAQYNNFTTSSPIQDDDAVTWTMAGRQVNEVRHLVDIGELLVFTSGGEWAINGNESGILVPGGINPKQHSYNGSSQLLPPIVINGNALYVQARGSIIRDFGFDYQVDGYRGNELTIFANHLFDNYTLVDWAFQQVPNSILWVVRDDGVLLGLTYVREHQVLAWHKHTTDGLYKNVCVVPEGNEDILYVVVERTIGGETKKYVERMSSRQLNDIEDMTLMDSYLTYDGRNTDDTHTMTLTGGTTWAYDEDITIGSSASYFNINNDVGKQIHLTGPDGDIIRLTLMDDIGNSPTEFLCRPNRTVPADMRGEALSTWSLAIQEVSGLWHLEGKAVSVFADALVAASPNNASYDTLTVEDGRITLDNHYAVIHAGLPYTCDFESLSIDTSQGETLADKNKLITEVTLQVENTRGLWAGSKPPTDDEVDPLENLREFKIRDTEGYDEAVDLKSGTINCQINGSWTDNGRVFIRQVDPVPASILSVIPAGFVGGGGS